MQSTSQTLTVISRDFTSGLVVFVVALPLCLGIALASGAPLISGIISGVIGGVLVGLISGSHVSVSGPGNTLMAITAAQVVALGSFQGFLLALTIAGMMQIVLAAFRAGIVAAFFPSSVIKGLLAAIGIILVLKQIPHLFGHDTDPEGDMSFVQPDQETTISEIGELLFDIHLGATVIGLVSIAMLVLWDRMKILKKSIVPAPLVVVIVGAGLAELFSQWSRAWRIGNNHLVQVPVAETLGDVMSFLQFPDFTQLSNPAVYVAGLTIALVASLESLLNLEASDKIDPRQRTSPPNRELLAQGVGNLTAGLVGGIPITSVIVRSAVNINAGAQTKLSTIVHGVFLLVCVVFLPTWLNIIPLSCLAAILLVNGAKLASPALFKQMWQQGRYQFIPFVLTVVAIVLTDLLVGILIGLAIATGFILNSNLRRPIRRCVEKHLGGDILHIELANQVSFLNRAALTRALRDVPDGGHVLLDAQNTDYIDPDILDLIRDFREKIAPAHGVSVSLIGFRRKYDLQDQIRYVDYSTRELQQAVTPAQVLEFLKNGNERFRTGQRLTRDFSRQVIATAHGQHPLAVVLSCIDSRTPAEIIFDLGVGDIFSVRVAGNVSSRKVLGSIEYGCAVAGAKLVLVVGHTRCGAVSTAVTMACTKDAPAHALGCENVEFILQEIQQVVPPEQCRDFDRMSESQREQMIDAMARENVRHVVETITRDSDTLARLVKEGRIAIVGAMYDVLTGEIEFLADTMQPGQSAAAVAT
jgi:carbonic anhydrase/SulP family sulfate permease